MDRAARLDQLIDGAEELLTNLSDAHDPDIQALRDRVDGAINEARRAIDQGGLDLSVTLRDIGGTVDDYVHDHPWLALITGVLVAGTIAFMSGSAAGARKRSMQD